MRGTRTRPEVDECLAEASWFAERLEDAVESDEGRDVDLTFYAVVKPVEEAIAPERSNFHNAFDHRAVIPVTATRETPLR
jgi:hypothetical protein